MADFTPTIDLTSIPRMATLLVPLDGSRLAEATIPIALDLREHLNARVTLLHVLEHDAPESVHGDPHLRTEADATTYLAAVARRFAEGGEAVLTHVHPNPEHDVAKSIAAHAAEFGADLILIANHGRGGLRERIFGSIAQQVIREGIAPVLLVPVLSPAAVGRAFNCQTMGVLVNGTAEAETVLPCAMALAKGLDAVIHLILAVPTVGTLPGDRAAVATLVPGTTRAILELEEANLAGYATEVRRLLGESGVRVEVSIVRGDPASATLAEAERLEVDLLAFATHAQSGLTGLWNASFGSKVLSRYTRPLLLVPAR
ncbi:MAG TPA: universal stress protein [Thermomicrobiales bacterium]|nr:universal stress protein [Thermomicrobiales bacterium]